MLTNNITPIKRLLIQITQFIFDFLSSILVFIILWIPYYIIFPLLLNTRLNFNNPLNSISNIIFILILLIGLFFPTFYATITKSMIVYKASNFKIVNLDNSELTRKKWFLRTLIKQIIFIPLTFGMGVIGFGIFLFTQFKSLGKRDMLDEFFGTKIIESY